MRDVPSHISTMLSALRFSDPSPEALRTLTDSQWNDLLSRWGILRLMIPLRQVCGDDLPEWVRSRIDRNLVDNALRFERIKTVYGEFADALRGTGAEHLVIKGFAQEPGFVEHPRQRLQSDIDIYCPPESMIRARDVLSDLGYEATRGSNVDLSDHLPLMIRKTDWRWRGNAYDPEMPVSFELHHRFWNESIEGFGPTDLNQFWNRRIERSLDNFNFPALSPVDSLGYCALNVLRDGLRGPVSMQVVYELARFLHANGDNEEFWSNWRTLHDDSLRCTEAVSFRLASHFFACRASEEVECEINRLPVATKVWFQEYADSPFSRSFRENKDALWLQLSLIDSPRDKRTILFNGLIPTRIPSLEASYIQKSSGDGQDGFGSFRKRTRYVAYLSSRAQTHARLLPSTLWRGVRLWWSNKELGKDFLTFLAVSFLFNFGMYIFFFLYNLYLVDRGYRENVLGMITSAVTVGSVAGTVPAGILAQRLGLRKTLFVCFGLLSVISALRSLVVSEAALMALAFLAGSVLVIWAVTLLPAIARLTNERNRPFGFGLVFFIGISVGIFGGQAGGRLPGLLMRMNLAHTTLQAKEGALLLACAIVALAMLPVSRLEFSSQPSQERKRFPRNPFLTRFLIAMAVWGLAIGGFAPFFNVYFFRHLQLPVKQIGMIASFSHIPQLLAMLAAPAVFRKFGLVNGVVCAQIVTAVALACLATVSGTPAATAMYMTYVGFQWMSEPGLFSLLMNNVETSERTGASALNFLAINASQAVAATVAGISYVRFGYPIVLGVTAALAFTAACMFRLLLGKNPLSVPQNSHASLYGD
jgi:predicted MFS family arabinose efflux permease